MTPRADHDPDITIALPGEWFRVDPSNLGDVTRRLSRAHIDRLELWSRCRQDLPIAFLLVRLRGAPAVALSAVWSPVDTNPGSAEGAVTLPHVAGWDVTRIWTSQHSDDSVVYAIRDPSGQRCLVMTFTALGGRLDELDVDGFDLAAEETTWDA